MYESYFGFERAPFNNVPDTSFFYGSDRHTEALAQLLYTVEGRKGFAVLTGEIGAGKTTLTRALLRRFDPESTTTAVITNSRLTGVQLLYTVAREFGLEDLQPSRPKLLEAINSFLVRELAADRDVVLLIDEAQDLPISTLEEVRLISNFETEQDKLIQIILVGQPELRHSIDRPELKQLRQRVAMRYHLLPLDRAETAEYVAHRLRVASPTSPVRFSDRAINAVHRYSRGIPRLINLCCDKALLVAYTEDESKVDRRAVMEGLKEIEGSDFSFKVHERREVGEGEPEARKRPFIRLPFLGGKYR
ncbi:MAG: AAA family ATPase [Planctomycetes bacterium]|nr:AAA family ATPase [Planctomycetota bacterium]